MQAGLSPEVPPQAAAALVAHLRQNPEHAKRPPSELANQFGLSTEFVRNVLQGLQPRDAEQRDDHDIRFSFAFVGSAWRSGVNLFDRLSRRPTWFIAISMVVALVASVLIDHSLPSVPVVPGERMELDSLISIFIVFVTLGLHMAVYFYRRMARYALYGALEVWVFCGTLMMALVWARGAQIGGDEARFSTVFLVGASMFVLSLMYAGFGSIMAVLGAWVRMKVVEQQQERMTRQEMLERYFELQSRLQQGVHTTATRPHWEDFSIVVWFRRHPFLGSTLAGFLISLLTVLVLGPLGIDPVTGRPGVSGSPLLTAISILTGTAVFLLYIAAGFLTARLWPAVVCAILIFIGTIPPTLLPIGSYGPQQYTHTMHQISMGITFIFMIGVTAISALGGIVQQRANREQDLQGNDQAALVAEMLRIQWRLSDHVTNVCVMVVDAAKSSVMKAEADPLAVEYSFREYQEWLEAIGGCTNGRVHSTAGDGAVISFPTAEGALTAAKRIQTDLARFNREVNRLKSPFRLRIGLHAGEVAGNIDEVQFTEVIDIAAHVQEVAPISGIAVTDTVAAQLPGEQFLPLSVEADGHPVLLVMHPIDV